jgi:hypothetical protein
LRAGPYLILTIPLPQPYVARVVSTCRTIHKEAQMLRRILVTGVTAASIVGAGTGALAVTGSGSTSGSGTPADHTRRLGKALLHHAVHGQVVTHDDGGYVRHDGVLGTVASVSATSITVRASDGYRETFVVADRTIVRKRAGGSGSKSTISAVHAGDSVAVIGRTTDGTSGSATARVIVDGVSR